MTPRWQLFTAGLFVLVTIATTAPPGDQAKSDQHPKESSKDLKTEAADVVKDKRSQEDIMFGNQQNKPAGMVDDMLSFPERKNADNQADKSDPDGKADNSTQEDNKESSPDDRKKVERELQKNNKDRDDDRFDYYDYLDEANDFRVGDDSYDTSASDGANDYQYDDINALYRRKRNLKSVNRKRALRSSLEELLVNGKRLPRRALRLKRDVDVDDLLAMFGALAERQNNDRYYPELEVPKNYVPLEDLQEIADSELRYPYAVVDDSEGPGRLLEERPAMNRHFSGNSHQRENVPDWLLTRDSAPFTVARRSSYFYPLDYRHVMLPGQKRFGNDRSDFSRWGKIPQRSNSLDDDGDLERLYELASLLEEAQQGNNY